MHDVCPRAVDSHVNAFNVARAEKALDQVPGPFPGAKVEGLARLSSSHVLPRERVEISPGKGPSRAS